MNTVGDGRLLRLLREARGVINWACMQLDLMPDEVAALMVKLDAALASRPDLTVGVEPDVHSYDPSPERRTVTVRWPDGKFLHYTLTRMTRA